MKRSFCALVVVSFVFISCVALADEVDPSSGSAGMLVGGTLVELGTPTANPDGETFSLHEVLNTADFDLTLDLTYDPDPWVQGGFSVKNKTASTQTYTFTFSAPISPNLTLDTLYGGSMSGSISSDLTTGATVSTVSGTPLFEGFINGTSYLSFYPDVSSWTIPAFSSGSIPAKNQAITLAGPSPAHGYLDIVFTFTLTPGDVATMNGRMDLVEVPEPATLALLGLGGLLLRKRRI